ncbi:MULTISPECIES: hypothetical protein [unclassified Shewanella]|uniref:hypothetical protein n=1 Tax=unclassified Shewanella TaxID=196818 RepID=UPI0002EDD7F5|nr:MULTISPECIES: hypothetical protein [unclassified Shewanella]MDH0448695.1 hypothetical protein [Shewanella sp. GD04112]
MAKSLNELRKRLKPQVQLAARAKAEEILAEMSMKDVTKSRGHNEATVEFLIPERKN